MSGGAVGEILTDAGRRALAQAVARLAVAAETAYNHTADASAEEAAVADIQERIAKLRGMARGGAS